MSIAPRCAKHGTHYRDGCKGCDACHEVHSLRESLRQVRTDHFAQHVMERTRNEIVSELRSGGETALDFAADFIERRAQA